MSKEKRNKKGTYSKEIATPEYKSVESRINTDPMGSWTGVVTDDVYDMPIQDADDL